MAKTLIAWADFSFNPWIGCSKVGVGCTGCFAEAYDNRFGGGHWGPGAPRRRTSHSTRSAPEKWNLKAEANRTLYKVFSHSLSDVFDNEVPDEWRADEFKLWKRTPYLRWIVLTKRPGNILKMLPSDWHEHPHRYRNVGFCVSVSTQEEFDREVPKLLQVRAAWHGVSIEPQVELVSINTRLDTIDTTWLDWIITGGASAQPGYDPPPYNVDWARSLIAQCRNADIACFVKQLGANPYDGDQPLTLRSSKAGADPEEWPADIRVQEFPEQLLR